MRSNCRSLSSLMNYISSFVAASMVPEESITQNEGYTYGKGISFFKTSLILDSSPS